MVMFYRNSKLKDQNCVFIFHILSVDHLVRRLTFYLAALASTA